MSKITLKSLELKKQKQLNCLLKKLNELIVIEKEFSSEGFEIVIQLIKKKD